MVNLAVPSPHKSTQGQSEHTSRKLGAYLAGSALRIGPVLGQRSMTFHKSARTKEGPRRTNRNTENLRELSCNQRASLRSWETESGNREVLLGLDQVNSRRSHPSHLQPVSPGGASRVKCAANCCPPSLAPLTHSFHVRANVVGTEMSSQ